MTAATGTGYMKYLCVVTEHFDNFKGASVNSQGASAYLAWNFVLFVKHVTLLRASCVDFINLFTYVRWNFKFSTWIHEHSSRVTDVLAQYWVNYIFALVFLAAG